MHRVVIIGGGFAGLNAAKRLAKPGLQVTLIDKRNFHLFQPLLYQVATGGLSPGDIASPLRAILKKKKNVKVIQDEVCGIDPKAQTVSGKTGNYPYDTLIVATGVKHHYFGNSQWRNHAPGLKTIEDALEMRQRILSAFELAEKEQNQEKKRNLLRFAIIGAGPTGVELAGALAELAQATMRDNFRSFKSQQAEIHLFEGSGQVLPAYPQASGSSAAKTLTKLGVNLHLNTLVTHIEGSTIHYRTPNGEDTLKAHTVLWAAGVKASRLGTALAQATKAETDKSGRLITNPHLCLAEYPNILILGDLAHVKDKHGQPLPGVAPVAMQQGRYAAKLVLGRLNNQNVPPFKYLDKGSLAVIGRNAAVANVGKFRFGGVFAWLVWALVHIHYLIEFDNKLMVGFQWGWSYLTRKRGARLITDIHAAHPDEL